MVFTKSSKEKKSVDIMSLSGKCFILGLCVTSGNRCPRYSGLEIGTYSCQQSHDTQSLYMDEVSGLLIANSRSEESLIGGKQRSGIQRGRVSRSSHR